MTTPAPVTDSRLITFTSELQSLLNKHGKESGSNTPDFILAEFLVNCLGQFGHAVRQRAKWYGLMDRLTPPAAQSSALERLRARIEERVATIRRDTKPGTAPFDTDTGRLSMGDWILTEIDKLAANPPAPPQPATEGDIRKWGEAAHSAALKLWQEPDDENYTTVGLSIGDGEQLMRRIAEERHVLSLDNHNAIVRERDATIERLTKERDEARASRDTYGAARAFADGMQAEREDFQLVYARQDEWQGILTIDRLKLRDLTAEAVRPFFDALTAERDEARNKVHTQFNAAFAKLREELGTDLDGGGGLVGILGGIVNIRAERDALKSKLAALVAAADAYCPADDGVWLDAQYDAFYDETGHWPNGRDRPAAMGGYDRAASHEAWCAWIKPRNEMRRRALRDAIEAARREGDGVGEVAAS